MRKHGWGAFAEIDFARLIAEQTPMIFRGLAADLPLVKAGLRSPEAAMDYLRQFYGGKPVLVFKGEPEIRGRFGYTPQCRRLQLHRRTGAAGPFVPGGA